MIASEMLLGKLHPLLLAAITALFFMAPPASAQSAATRPPEVIVVTGRLPGPPLWRVSSGDHVLWIFATLTTVPQDMEWDTARVQAVLDKADAYLPLPNVSFTVPAKVMINPINWVRGVRLQNRLSRNGDGRLLQEVLSPALSQRYTALQQIYFPTEELEELRPSAAAQRMRELVFEAVGLGSAANNVVKPLDRLVRNRRNLHHFDTQFDYELQGSFGTLAERAETMMASLSQEQEQACVEWHLNWLETNLDAMKNRANAWAQGLVSELQALPSEDSSDDPCFSLLLDSSEGTMLVDSQEQSRQYWLQLAEEALANHAVSLAVLDINELSGDGGLLARLRAMGYQVREPLE